MKKELTTKQDYLDSHLKEFEAIYFGEKVKGIIFIENNNIFLFNNNHDSCRPINKSWKEYGYKYCHQRLVFEGFVTYFHSLTIEVEEQWKPKFGELVEVSHYSDDRAKWEQRIYIGTEHNFYHCVAKEDENAFNEKKSRGYRVYNWNYMRQIETQKPVKRLPTIEEVIKWFEENKIFKSKTGRIVRILGVIPNEKSPIEIHNWYTIKEFCDDFTDQNDNELYITE